jgi:hypothetical protein
MVYFYLLTVKFNDYKMIKYFGSVLLFIVLTTTSLHATTWDEPWAEKVIRESSSFILGKVIDSDSDKGIKVVVINTLCGRQLKDTILINGFYALTICSSSGEHGAEFLTQVIDSCYFFISQNQKGQFCIATPTTGFDYVVEDNVIATFRHSYHQASVPVSVYEKTMTAIFNHYHNLPYDKDYITSFITAHLSKTPAGFSNNEINTFFLQHVALECIYHLKLSVNERLIFPFLSNKTNFHHQVSAARAMRSINTETVKQELIKAIEDTSRRDFVKIMCVWSLSELNPKEFKTQLLKIEKKASGESDGFGGNIMDPRVCTKIPTVKKVLKDLISKL